ncbi:MAG: hypothetical protein AB7E95_11260 [Kiritimatiellales bacterium]
MRNPIKPMTDLNGLPVLTPSNDEAYSYYSNYLLNNRELLDAMIIRHSKVLFLRFDVRFPDTYCWSEPMMYWWKFLDLLRRWLVENGFDPQYVVRMEQKTSLNPHFHVGLLLNGNKANEENAYFYKLQAEQIWQKVLGVKQTGLVDFCNKDYWGNPMPEGILIVRPPERTGVDVRTTLEYIKVFKAMSYLAKYTPEDQIPSSQRKVFYSQCNR